MNRHVRELGGLAACALGSYLMASALFGHGWLVGEWNGLEVGGGVIDVHFCSKADDPDPLPMGIGDLDGCMSSMYARSELRGEFGSWFGASGHMTLLFGAGSALLFMLFTAIRSFAMEIEIAPRQQPLSAHLFDVDDGAVVLHTHPATAAARMGVTACVALVIALNATPEMLSVGPDVLRFLAGCALAVVGAFAVDPRTLRPGAEPIPIPTDTGPLGSAAADAPETVDAEALPEAPVAELEPDTPECVKCGGTTAWLDDVGRHRCGKCGLYQPLHAPGSQVDRFE